MSKNSTDVKCLEFGSPSDVESQRARWGRFRAGSIRDGRPESGSGLRNAPAWPLPVNQIDQSSNSVPVGSPLETLFELL